MNLPNKLTIFRIILIPVFIALFLYCDKTLGKLLCTVVFTIASITDFVDGHIARKYNLVSNFGKFADPLADKMLVTAALICLCFTGDLNPWYVIIITFREFMVTGIRILAISAGKVIAAGTTGKIKTVIQLFAIIAMLFDRIYVLPFGISFILMTLAVILTVYSGAEYLISNIGLFKNVD
ncbi:MAG: CDP-diacylglycerol--glycerol-3-phosphate 3-phosphatidyltransferase [Clostridia bacterium]|nr:CDP-diacylglycerol--glycerol-3-phosphate 3-phosphatidyltransferase [Clostridia bacterium]